MECSLCDRIVIRESSDCLHRYREGPFPWQPLGTVKPAVNGDNAPDPRKLAAQTTWEPRSRLSHRGFPNNFLSSCMFTYFLIFQFLNSTYLVLVKKSLA